MHTKLVEKLEKMKLYGDLGVDGRMMVKLILTMN